MATTPASEFKSPRLAPFASPSSSSASSSSVAAAAAFVSPRLPSRYFRPTLVELCVPLLARQPHVLSLLATVPPDIRPLLVSKLPLDLSLDDCAKFIPDEEYWKRRATVKWKSCDFSCHGRSWKQLYFERNLADELESFDPTLGDGTKLIKLMELSEPYVHNLRICQLPSHLAASVLFGGLGRNLASLKLEYGWRNARMLYDPAKFGMKISDCLSFSSSLCLATSLTDLDLSCNLLDDEKVKILLKGMSMNPTLVKLNLSHNRIADAGVAELSLYLQCDKCVLGGLNLGDNSFSAEGAKYLAEALKSNDVLMCINLGYNKLTDAGGKVIFDALQTNTELQRMDMGSCGLGEETAGALGRLMSSLRPPLIFLNISANPCIGAKGGTAILESLEGGKPPHYLDVQLCEMGDELVKSIADVVSSRNQERLVESLSKYKGSP